jgi:hypothetical protein
VTCRPFAACALVQRKGAFSWSPPTHHPDSQQASLRPYGPGCALISDPIFKPAVASICRGWNDFVWIYLIETWNLFFRGRVLGIC